MNESSKLFDIVIVGAGPAGLTAALYAGRERMKVVVLEKNLCGGWLNLINRLENFPGFPEGTGGPELAERLRKQAEKYGAGIREGIEVKGISAAGEGLLLETDSGALHARALIAASGCRRRKLGLKGEDRLLGKGVSYCAVCDAPLYRGRRVAVIGGGDAALDEALFLTRFAARVYILHRRRLFRGSRLLEERLRALPQVEFVLGAVPEEIEGEEKVKALRWRGEGGSQGRLEVDGIFILAGLEPNSEFLRPVLELDAEKFVVADSRNRTSLPGVFAAGDIRSGALRQAVAACADGAAAALAARELLEK